MHQDPPGDAVNKRTEKALLKRGEPSQNSDKQRARAERLRCSEQKARVSQLYGLCRSKIFMKNSS